MRDRAIQMAPSSSSRIALTHPPTSGNVTMRSFVQCASPPVVPIHRLPSRAPSRERTVLDGSGVSGGGAQGTKRTPSKRTSPALVPIHKYPSVVWPTALGILPRNPSRTRQAVWAYCEILTAGSSAAIAGGGGAVPWTARAMKMTQGGCLVMGLTPRPLASDRPKTTPPGPRWPPSKLGGIDTYDECRFPGRESMILEACSGCSPCFREAPRALRSLSCGSPSRRHCGRADRWPAFLPRG